MEVGEIVCPEDGHFTDRSSMYFHEDERKNEWSWKCTEPDAGRLVREHEKGFFRRKIGLEEKWPHHRCEFCKFFVINESFQPGWIGQCRRHSPPFAAMSRIEWCGDYVSGLVNSRKHYAKF